MRLLRFVPMLGLALAACKDSTGPRYTPQLAVIGGAGQTDTVIRELPQLVEVQVTAAETEAPMANYPINWVPLNGGSVFAPMTNTGSDGVARQRITLGPRAGAQCFAARALDPNTGDIIVDEVVCQTAVPDSAKAMGLAVDSIHGRVGDTIRVALGAADAHGNIGAYCAPVTIGSTTYVAVTDFRVQNTAVAYIVGASAWGHEAGRTVPVVDTVTLVLDAVGTTEGVGQTGCVEPAWSLSPGTTAAEAHVSIQVAP